MSILATAVVLSPVGHAPFALILTLSTYIRIALTSTAPCPTTGLASCATLETGRATAMASGTIPNVCERARSFKNIHKGSRTFTITLKNVQERSRTFKNVHERSITFKEVTFPLSELNVTFRDEMPRAATNKVQGTKTAKPKASTDKGAGKQPAKKKTATGGARVALNLANVAADKPHEAGSAVTVLDRTVPCCSHDTSSRFPTQKLARAWSST